MRPVLVLTILATLTAACATPRQTPRPVIVHRAPTVVVYEDPIPVESTKEYESTHEYTGTYPMAGGGHDTGISTTTSTGTQSRPYTPTTSPFQKNPVPGSAREYINRYPSGGAMAK